MNIDVKILNKILANQIHQCIKKNYTPQSSGIYSRYTRLVRHSKSINVIHDINRLKKKSHMIISIEADRALDKIQHPFMIKTHSKLGIEGNFLNLRRIYKKSTANIILNGEKCKAFPLRSGASQRHFLLTTLFNIVLELPTNAIGQ